MSSRIIRIVNDEKELVEFMTSHPSAEIVCKQLVCAPVSQYIITHKKTHLDVDSTPPEKKSKKSHFKSKIQSGLHYLHQDMIVKKCLTWFLLSLG